MYNRYIMTKKAFPKGSKIEFKIENYLEKNIDIIENDLKLIKRQYKLYHKSKKYIGAIDLFCQGSDGAQVVVELKSKELGARDLGQIMAYYAVCKQRSITHNLPNPRLYCIGLSVGPQYKMGLTILNGGKDINLTTQTYSIISEKENELEVVLKDYLQEYEGTLSLRAL